MNRALDYSSFLRIYHYKFTPAYADLVTLSVCKPEQILGEMENILVHLMQTGNTAISPEQQSTNLEKARNHLIRVTLDCHKLLWAEMRNKIDNIRNDKYLRKYAVNMEEHKFLQLIEDFDEKAKEARRGEMKNVGIASLKSIELYEEATLIGWKIFKKIDPQKKDEFSMFHIVYNIKYHIATFIVGTISGVIATLLYQFLFSSYFSGK